MLKELFHKNSIEIFSFLEKIGFLKLTRFLFSSEYKSLDNIPLWKFMFTTPELHKSNDWYGHATAFKKYARLKNDYPIKAAIEHGPFFGSFIWPQDLNNSLPAMITFSKKRAKFLEKKTGKKIYSVGPYIHYAKHHLSKKKLEQEKKRLGKNLLVFPVHSTSISGLDYDIEEFCKAIKKLSKQFDTVRVCLYWKDILHEKDKVYKKYGFEVVTAGHVFDSRFLPRLKSIIALSSATMSNSVGTHLGYSVFLKKPHYLYKQKIKVPKNDIDAKRGIAATETDEYKQMEKAFSITLNQNKYGSGQAMEQYRLASSFFGFDQIKTPRQLKKILL